MTTNQKLYAVVYHPCYSPRGYRVYQSDDQYLENYPSMYKMVRDGLELYDAEQLCDELLYEEEQRAYEWAREIGLIES